MNDPIVQTSVDAAPRRSLWRSVKAIGWAFLGVRSTSGYGEDFRRVKPLHVIVVAFLATVVFVLLLAGLSHWVVHH
ncbi:MAG: hypothetical protein OJF60_001054 [Burkholderiaceae bacterium]|nr:MAG: hypothetical protein OJF60_001054 [Burkholderiaceae bacterium]